MEFETVEYDHSEGVAEIIIDRPEAMNAFDEATVQELIIAIETALADDAAYAILLTGAGEAFCAGADLSVAAERNRAFAAGDCSVAAKREYLEYAEDVVEVFRLLYSGPKPTVAAINGPAIGAGSDFALACDLRVMSERAVMREQFVNLGFVAADGGGWLLPRLVGEAKAKEYLLTGRDISPTAADDMGLVVDVVEAGDALPTARDLARELRDKPATAMRYTKELIGTGQSFDEYVTAGLERQWEARQDPEQAEAVAAFLEDREPEYDRDY